MRSKCSYASGGNRQMKKYVQPSMRSCDNSERKRERVEWEHRGHITQTEKTVLKETEENLRKHKRRDNKEITRHPKYIPGLAKARLYLKQSYQLGHKP